MAGPSRPSGSFQLADVYDNMDSVYVSSELTSLATLPTFHEESQGSLGGMSPLYIHSMPMLTAEYVQIS